MANPSSESPSTNSPALVVPPEIEAAQGKLQKLEPESHDPMTMSYEELKAMYDDINEPYCYATTEFTYRNKARIKREEVIAEYPRQNQGRGVCIHGGCSK